MTLVVQGVKHLLRSLGLLGAARALGSSLPAL